MKRKGILKARSAASVYTAHSGPNMTPMVDVVMVILVFFMASAAVLGPEWFVRSVLPVRSSAAPSNSTVNQVTLTFHPGGSSVNSADQQATGFATLSAQINTSRESVIVPSPPEVNSSETTESIRAAIEKPLAILLAKIPRENITIGLIIPAPTTRYEHIVAAHEAFIRAGVTKVGTIESAEK